MENEREIIKFEPADAADLQNEMQPHFWALKTLGELMAAADGHGGFCETVAASMVGDVYGIGINVLIQNCIDAQEKILDDFRERAFNSPEWIIQEASRTLAMAEAKRRKSEEDIQRIRNTLENLNLILAKFGSDDYPKANSIKKALRGFDPESGARILFQMKTFLTKEGAIKKPESFISEAFHLCDAAISGGFGNDEKALEEIRKCMNLVDLIFSKYGFNKYPKASTVMSKLRDAETFIFQGRRKESTDSGEKGHD